MRLKSAIGSMIGWILRHRRLSGIVLTGLTTLATATWAIVTLIYPDFIKPEFEPGKISFNISYTESARTSKYIVEQIEIETKNTGINRAYLPSTAYLIRAFKISSVRDSSNSVKSQTEAAASPIAASAVKKSDYNDALKKYMASLSPSDRETLVSQASNYILRSEWREGFKNDDLIKKRVSRGLYQLDDPSGELISIGRLTGQRSFLEPGESETTKIIAIIPLQFDVMIVDGSAISSKRRLDSVAFLPFPSASGLEFLKIERTENLGARVGNPNKEFSYTEGEVERVNEKIGGEFYRADSYSEFYIGAHAEIKKTSVDIPAVNTDQDKK